jgi:hypothetical protein
MRERAAEELNPKIGRIGAEDPSRDSDRASCFGILVGLCES